MTSSPKNNGFNAADIQRYHAGQMSASEMHALEKAALDDPFLADALEGFRSSENPSSELADLKQRLKDRIREKRSNRAIWWQAAAALLILSAGLWFFTRMNQSSDRSLAREEEAPATIADSTLSAQVQQKFADSATAAISPQNDVVTLTNTRISKPRAAKSPVAVTGQASGLEKDQAAPSLMPEESVRLQNKSFSMRADSVMKNESYAVMSAPDTVRNMNVTITPLPNSAPPEVVLRNGSVAKRKAERMVVIADTLDPTEGIARYNDYISANIQIPEEVKQKPEHGFVRLSFDVDEKGAPVNIAVVDSLCDACDQEAIRLLKEGPKWKKKKNKKGFLTIHF